jgi:hypothetical protein
MEALIGSKNMTFFLHFSDNWASAGTKHFRVGDEFGGAYEVSNRFAEISVCLGHAIRELPFGYRAG